VPDNVRDHIKFSNQSLICLFAHAINRMGGF